MKMSNKYETGGFSKYFSWFASNKYTAKSSITVYSAHSLKP